VAKYGTFRYGEKNFGAGAVPSLSVAPFEVLVLDYDDVRVSWTNPFATANGIQKFRIIRNQEGVPDTEEDGIIIFETNGVPNVNSLSDNGTTIFGETVPLIRGRHVYYSIWLWLGFDQDYSWYLAGIQRETVPSEHQVMSKTNFESTTHTRLLESLPKVLTSPEMNSLGAIDYSSDLAKFLQGFSFTADYLLTLTDLLLPNDNFINLTPELLNSYSLNFGINPENRAEDKPTKFQRKLLSNAITMYSTKGTTQALATFIESATGYAVDIQESSNLLLSAQDSTFYLGTGNWVAGTGAVLTHQASVSPPADGDVTSGEAKYRIDKTYCGYVAVTTAGATISLGSGSIGKKIPVRSDTSYSLWFYQKTSITANITVKVKWYDYLGNYITGADVTEVIPATSAWTKIGMPSVYAPIEGSPNTVTISNANPSVITLNNHNFGNGREVYFTTAGTLPAGLSANQKYYVVNSSTNTFNVSTSPGGSAVATTSAGSGVHTVQVLGSAKFASIELGFSQTGDYYIDMVNFDEDNLEEYKEPRGVGIVLSPTKINYITNPSFEGETTGWSATNAALAAVAYSGNFIAGQYAGNDYLRVTPSGTSEVTVSTTSNDVVFSGGDYTLSGFFRTEASALNDVKITMEAYALESRRNYVTITTPDSNPEAGWTFTSGGTFTQAFPTTGGWNNGAYAALNYTSSPSTGDIVVNIDGVTPALLDEAEYTFSIWVRCNSSTVIYPTITWKIGAQSLPVSGDDVTINANEWTQISFTTPALSGSDDVELSLTSAVADAATSITQFAVSDAEFAAVTYTKSVTLPASGVNTDWGRKQLTLTIPQDVVIPAKSGGLKVDVTISFTPVTGANLLLDAVQLENNYRASDYFDGNSWNANWDGGIANANEAESHMYSNKNSKLTRIQGKIREFLPIGTPFYIETTSGVEFQGAFKYFA